jgi:hypothetical protein
MTPNEILEIDAKRNHPPGTVAGNLRAVINQELRNKGHLVQQGNTLVVFRIAGPGTAEYHCFNADTPENLVKNVMVVWKLLKKMGFKKAITPYQNPKISDLLRQFAKAYKIDITKQGTGFLATTHLAGE